MLFTLLFMFKLFDQAPRILNACSSLPLILRWSHILSPWDAFGFGLFRLTVQYVSWRWFPVSRLTDSYFLVLTSSQWAIETRVVPTCCKPDHGRLYRASSSRSGDWNRTDPLIKAWNALVDFYGVVRLSVKELFPVHTIYTWRFRDIIIKAPSLFWCIKFSYRRTR